MERDTQEPAKQDQNENTATENEKMSETPVASQEDESANSTDDPKSEEVISTLPNQSVVQPAKKRRFTKKRWMLTLAVLLIAGGATTGVLLWRHKSVKHDSQPATVQAPVKTAAPEKTLTPLPQVSVDAQAALLQRFTHPTTGEAWLDAPKPLEDQKLLADQGTEVKYYEVGSRGDKRIVVADSFQAGPISYLFEVGADSKATYIAFPDADQTAEGNGWRHSVPAEGVAYDGSTHYDSLTLPRTLALDNGYKLEKPEYANIGQFMSTDIDKYRSVTTVRQVGQSTIQKIEGTNKDTNLTSIGYGIVLPSYTRIMMVYEPLPVSLKDYDWQEGATKVDDTLAAISRGCSAFYTAATRADMVTDEDAVQVGISSTGQAVYKFRDPNHVVMKKAYDEFRDFYAGSPDLSKYAKITLEEFVNQHAVVLFKDINGQWLVYARDELRPQGGCAKPVVYLYPQRPTQVTVRVAANVQVSEPYYSPLSGWSAWALPGGKLLVNGSLYDSLFWEGPGLGEYPLITSGTIVRRVDAPDTMRCQLREQGLNDKETQDFMAYWGSRLPNTPYVRLTWFNTEQMNRLAPLHIHPRPDTVIRTFVDFEGLETPIDLPPQQFAAPPRNGFTVVEWGGLAHTPLRP